jgi:hypothetical protein
MNDGGQIRPRLTKEELAFISYALLVLEQSAQHKLRELEFLPYALKRFAKFIWYSGDLKALRVFKPYKQYVLTELAENQDFVKLKLNAKTLRRRIEGLLNGKKLHSQEHWRY